LSGQAVTDSVLALIGEGFRHKYRIKNTTGYSLNALIDYQDPIDILSHLMIGSEGTLGFISSITYHTVAEDPFKASALVFFPDLERACQAVIRLKPQPVSAVELLDRPALRSVQDKPGLPAIMRTLGNEAAALLIEVRGETAISLQLLIDAAQAAMNGIATVEPPTFSTDPAICEMYWKVRKGTFPSVVAMRRTGTTVTQARRQGRGFQPAQHTEFAVRIRQTVEDHQAQASQDIDLRFGAPPGQRQIVKTQGAPEFRQGPDVTGMAAVGKAQAIQGTGPRCHAAGTLQRGNQGIDFAASFQATKSADGALAGLAFFALRYGKIPPVRRSADYRIE
jgi:FAD/FMN-containing dehydrogenase